MRAAVFNAVHDMALVERARPEPGPGEALVRVGAVGLCAGDLYIFTGKNPYVAYPRIGGHEIAGALEALGPDTPGAALGTPVVVDPFIGCGHCYACRVGKRNCCANLSIIGVHRDGGFAEAVIAPAAQIHAVPEGLSLLEASFAEPVAIGVQACRRSAVDGRDKVLVLGAGPIGLAIVEVARARGAEVYVADPNVGRIAVAERLGARPLPAGGALLPAVAALTGGEGMPVVVEATGVPSVIEQTLDLVASGGRVVIAGLVGKGVEVRFPGLDLTRKEATILGTRASVDCFPEALGLLAAGAIQYPRIATTMPLGDAPAMFARLAADPGAFHKAVFVSEFT